MTFDMLNRGKLNKTCLRS